jgi:digeranylgeranylglycerophospholipid reductase
MYNKNFDVIVVGGGPVGCFTAKHLALQGFKVLLLENHVRIGEPVQCAGLISPRALELSGVSPKVVLNKLTSARVYSSEGACLELNSPRVQAVAVDRAAFDQELANQAQAAGVFLLTEHWVNGIEYFSEGFRVLAVRKGEKKIVFTARLIIGADGANSQVARWLKLKNAGSKAVICAAEADLQRTQTELVDIFLGQTLAPGWFGWIIPLDEKRCRIGTGYAFVKPAQSSKNYLNKLIQHYPKHFKELRITRFTGGIVPIGIMPKIYAPHAMLVGDAACQTKPISGGGIYTGLRGAQLCYLVAVQALKEDDLSQSRLAMYQDLWEAEMGSEILCGISHRQSFLEFNDVDIDSMLRFLNKPFWKKIILKFGDIDYPSGLTRRLAGASPWKMKFLKAFIKAGLGQKS